MTWCSICVTGTTGIRPRQLVEDGPLFALCARCDELDVTPGHAGRRPGKYIPLDESECGMAYRILRAVRRFDWVSPWELAEALVIPSSTVDARAQNAFSVVLSRLARSGYLKRRHVLETAEYKITRKGLARIDRVIRAAFETRRSLAA